MARVKNGMAIESADVEVAREVLALVAGLIIIIALLSIFVTYSVSHDFIGSVYYTISSLIDLNNEGYAFAIITSLQPFGSAFYTVAGIELLDGVAKVVLIGFLVAVLIDALTSLDINSKINVLKSSRLEKHVVLCGYSGLGEQISEALKDKNRRLVVVEKSPTKLEELNERGYTALDGDFTDMEVLRKAGVERASSVVFCSDSDITNLMGIVAARRLNREIMVVSRAREEFSVTKMQRAGADLCIIPELVAGVELGNKLVAI
ncbi:MAG: NAD-binding protein [Candidatus Micrarchaeota archaeon]|nr:NAD-binding protein [Candidatus Micrarchaeota archaeon]